MKFVRIIKFYAKIESDNSEKAGRYNQTTVYDHHINDLKVQNKQYFENNIVRVFLSISLNICFGAQLNRLIETVLFSTRNICFAWQIRKYVFDIALLSKVKKTKIRKRYNQVLHLTLDTIR